MANANKTYTQSDDPSDVGAAAWPLPFTRTPHLTLLVGVSDIARLLGLSNPAVVTNWRSRSRDFPVERAGGSQPRFDLAEVLQWLWFRGPRGRTMPTVSPEAWWGEIAKSYVAVAHPHAARNTVLALVLLRRVLLGGAHTDDDGRQLWDRIRERSEASLDAETDASVDTIPGASEALSVAAQWAEHHDPSVVGLLVPYLRLEPRLATYACDLVAALERAVAVPTTRLAQAVVELDVDGRRHESRRTLDAVSSVMVSLARPEPGAVVLDPAVGEGSLLLEFAHRADPAKLAGQEADADTWALVRTRFLLEGLSLDVGERNADTLVNDLHRKLRADVVLLDPPLDRRDSSLGRWIAYGLQHLVPGGRMVVALPLHELVRVKSVRRQPDDRVRTMVRTLMTEGRVESVVVLPRGARSDIAGPVAVVAIGDEVLAREIVVVGIVLGRRRSGELLGPSGREFLERMRSDGPHAFVGTSIGAEIIGVSASRGSVDDTFSALELLADDVPLSVGGERGSSRSSIARPSMSRATWGNPDLLGGALRLETVRHDRGRSVSELVNDPAVAELLQRLAMVPAPDRQEVVERLLLDLQRITPPLQ